MQLGSKAGLKPFNQPLRNVFGDALLNVASENPRVVVLDGDLGNSTKAELVRQNFPERFHHPKEDLIYQRMALRDWQDIPFPRWPVDTTVQDLEAAIWNELLQLSGTDRLPFIWYWPEGRRMAATLTHIKSRMLLPAVEGDEGHVAGGVDAGRRAGVAVEGEAGSHALELVGGLHAGDPGRLRRHAEERGHVHRPDGGGGRQRSEPPEQDSWGLAARSSWLDPSHQGKRGSYS